MAYTGAQLLALQANIKRDPDGYRDEFMLQYRHYRARLNVFSLRPSEESHEFAELVGFIAQVSKCYPRSTAGFAPELVALLEAQHAVLDAGLRRAMVQALILLRNRNQLDPAVLLPLLFRLFRVNDKALRALLFRHIVADLKASNQRARNERLNRSVQSFLYGILQDDNEMAAKKSLAVLTELWHRNVWRDARTVNIIASAAFHRSLAVCLAVMRFFLGQDTRADGDDGTGDEGEPDAAAAVMPSKQEFYKATKQGTASSKKRKQAKLKRAVAAVKKQARREAMAVSEGFAAVHLLYDPQSFAERLFARLQGSHDKWEARTAMMAVTSRVVGVHKLLLLNLYTFLQKYVAPHQRDVMQVLSALVQAAHELVPPETLQPVLRQLVDAFVHDRARPEVIVVGLKTARELCLRCPLLMGPELLQDLAAYRKFRDQEVAAAARSLVGLFRDINPALLAKRDRGRGADMAKGPGPYGTQAISERVPGADLLQRALARGDSSDDQDHSCNSTSSSDLGGSGSGTDDDSDGSGSTCSSSRGASEGRGTGFDSTGHGDDRHGAVPLTGKGRNRNVRSRDIGASSDGSEGTSTCSAGDGDRQVRDTAEMADSGSHGSEQQEPTAVLHAHGPSKRQVPQPGSLADLKRRLAAASTARPACDAAAGLAAGAAPERGLDPALPLEMQRFLTDDDFQRIRELKHRQIAQAALARHGLKSLSKAKLRRLELAAEEEADDAIALEQQLAAANEGVVQPEQLAGHKKRARDKAGRIASILEGREGREEFGSRAARKKQKTGSKSEREKQRAKQMPIAARIQQLRNRTAQTKQRRNPKHFKGHVRGK